MRDSSIVAQNLSQKSKELGLAARSSRLLGLKNLVRVSNFHETLQQ